VAVVGDALRLALDGLPRATSISAPEISTADKAQVRIIVSRRGFTATRWYACADLLLGARTRVAF